MAIDTGQPDTSVDEWYRMMLVDRHGRKIGMLEHIYVDVETDVPQFATVRGGFVDRRLTIVPLTGIAVDTEVLRLAVTRAAIRSAPQIELFGDDLLPADERALYRHFVQPFVPPTVPGGCRLVRR